jgi:threonine dehydratase
MSQRSPDRAGVLKALEKLKEVVLPTPLFDIEITGRRVWLKAESLQPIGAFKLRGAWHRLTDLSESERARGVVAFSSGNHAQGVAWAARRLGIRATIVMPTDSPATKLDNTRALGAEVVLYDRMTESREAIAARIAAEHDSVVVPSFDDPWVVEGQGTAGIEACVQMASLGCSSPEHIVTPCGGGGLAAGLALAVPDAKLTIVEPEGWDDMARSLAQGSIVPVGSDPPATACDALQTLKVAPLTFDILKAHGSVGCGVGEREVGKAMRWAFDNLRLVLEPGGAIALAAVLSGKVPPRERTLVMLSGGNVDAATFTRMTGL